MNLVTLRRGEGLFVPAGVLHAYLAGLGVELMAASDNVLRGGLTPKHIDVAELLAVLDSDAGTRSDRASARPSARASAAMRRAGRRLRASSSRMRTKAARPRRSGRRRRDRARDGGSSDRLGGEHRRRDTRSRPGDAVLVTPDEGELLDRGRRRGLRRPPGALTPCALRASSPLSQCDTPSARREGSRAT